MTSKGPIDPEPEHYSGDTFSEHERQYLRLMMERDKHMEWLWPKIRNWLFYIFSGVAGIVMFRENIKAIWLWFVK